MLTELGYIEPMSHPLAAKLISFSRLAELTSNVGIKYTLFGLPFALYNLLT